MHSNLVSNLSQQDTIHLPELAVWLRKRFDAKINFYPVRGCPICYLKSQSTLHFKVEHPVEANDIVHPAGFSRFPYGTHYDPKFIVLNYYDVWFSMDSPEILITVAHEALHGYHCTNN